MGSLCKYFIFYLAVGYLNLLFSFNIPNPYYRDRVLVDFGFQLLPTISIHIPNLIIVLWYVYFFAKFYITNREVLIKYYRLLTILFIIRLFSFTLTHIPPCLESCISLDSSSLINTWYETNIYNLPDWNSLSIFFNFLNPEIYRGCSDNMFSGHAIHISLMALYTIYYSREYCDAWFSGLLYFPYMLMLIASKMHYSADVYIGCVLAIMIFYLDEYKLLYENMVKKAR